MEDSHNLKGNQAFIREALLLDADLQAATAWAQTSANDLMDGMDRAIRSGAMDQPTAILGQALIAHTLCVLTAEWWSNAPLPLPDTTAAVRSIVTDLPTVLDYVTFIPKGN